MRGDDHQPDTINRPPPVEHRHHNDFIYNHRREIAWGVIIPATALVVTLFTWVHGVYMDLLDNDNDISNRVAVNTQARTDAAKANDILLQRLDRLETKLDKTADSVRDVQASCAP